MQPHQIKTSAAIVKLSRRSPSSMLANIFRPGPSKSEILAKKVLMGLGIGGAGLGGVGAAYGLSGGSDGISAAIDAASQGVNGAIPSGGGGRGGNDVELPPSPYDQLRQEAGSQRMGPTDTRYTGSPLDIFDEYVDSPQGQAGGRGPLGPSTAPMSDGYMGDNLDFMHMATGGY